MAMHRQLTATGLCSLAFAKVCPARATPTTMPWPKNFSVVSNANSYTYGTSRHAARLRRLYLPTSRLSTTPSDRIPLSAGSRRAPLKLSLPAALLPNSRNPTKDCDSFRFLELFPVRFYGKGSPYLLHSLTDYILKARGKSTFTIQVEFLPRPRG